MAAQAATAAHYRLLRLHGRVRSPDQREDRELTMASNNLPALACSLEFSEMGPRLERLRHLTDSGLISHERRGNALHLAYRPEVSGEVKAIVELERDCCRFLDFDVQESSSGAKVTITAPDTLGDAAKWLFSQFLPTQPGTKPLRRPCCASCT